jgi:hypothetical protein
MRIVRASFRMRLASERKFHGMIQRCGSSVADRYNWTALVSMGIRPPDVLCTMEVEFTMVCRRENLRRSRETAIVVDCDARFLSPFVVFADRFCELIKRLVTNERSFIFYPSCCVSNSTNRRL